MKYRKKPVVIEAVQWLDGPFPKDSPTWLFEAFGGGIIKFPTTGSSRLYIETLEGPLYASPGDFIIQGIKGEIYPCKPDIFAATYEPA